MNNNYFARRQHLMSVFEDTMARIKNSRELQEAISISIASQRFISEDKTISLPEPRYTEPAEVTVTTDRSFEAAAKYKDCKTAVLNFASAKKPGGGVENGSSAQEEGLCRVSTLLPCLKDEKMWQCFYAPHRNARNPLHNDDIIYTKDVVVFKDDDYNPIAEQFRVDVITCAAPNLNEVPTTVYNPDNGEVRAGITDDELLKLHERRGRKILSVAAANGAEVLILGAFGCGAFSNDPNIVAQAYRNILPEYMQYFRIIEFAVYCRPTDRSNYLAFQNKFANIN